MRSTDVAVVLIALFAAPIAGAADLDLGTYQLAATYTLNDPRFLNTNNELSALTWDWDTGTLFSVEDEAGYIYEFGTDGTYISRMKLSGFDDTEALTYVGNGQFVVGQERVQNVQKFTYVPNGTLAKGSTVALWKTTDPEVPAATNPAGLHSVGNVGLEGIAYDQATGDFVYVKEKTPTRLREASIDFDAGTASITDIVPPGPESGGFTLPGYAGTLADLSDVTVLSSGNLLLVSQESQVLLETTGDGQVLGFYSLAALGTRIEGVAVDPDGNIYLTNEGITVADGGTGGTTPAQLFKLSPSPVPLPAGVWLFASGLGALGFASRRKSQQLAA